MQEMSAVRRVCARMSAYYFLFAAGMSSYVSFVTMWQHSIGYSAMLIGALSAASALVAMLAQPVFSLAADRAKVKNTVLRILLAAQAVAAFLHMVPGPWPYVLAVMSAFTAVQSAALGLSNAVILDSLKCHGAAEKFGGIRLSHSWGFALAGLAAGAVASTNMSLVFVLCGVVNLLALAISFLLPVVPGYQQDCRHRMGLRSLLGYREFLVLIAYSLAIHITHSLAVAFLPVYFAEMGAPNWVYGLGIFVMAAAETPFLLLSGKLLNRFSTGRLMLIPGVTFTLRWFLTAAATEWWQLLAVYALHGLGVVVIYVCLARYVSDCLPKELSATGQGAVNAYVISASRVVGALMGGLLSTWIGMRATFEAMGWVTLVAGGGLLVYVYRSHQGSTKKSGP